MEVIKMNTYSFWAECEHDVDELRKVVKKKIERITKIIQVNPNFHIEVEVETDMSLEVLRDEMRKVIDGHVMVQTVASKNQYTGERDFSIE
jgi:ribosome-associated translation inhibitor RaiA